MRIEFLNVWGGRTGDVLEKYLKEEVKKIDVFCFQESKESFLEMSKRALESEFFPNVAYKYVNKDDVFFQAVWVRKSIEKNRVSILLDDISKVGLAVNCQIENGGRLIDVCNIHGISRPGDKRDSKERIKQSQGLIEYFQEFQERGGRVIIGGDFNLSRGTESINMFAEAGYRNLIEKFKVRTTRNELAWKKYPDNPQLDSDFVFVGPGIRVKEFRVVDNLVSDHLPMILEME